MNRFLLQIMVSATVLLTFAGTASAEAVKGRLKAIAEEITLFSLIDAQEKVLLISWDDKTVWQGIGNPADLKLDENLTVDFKLNGGNSIAATVSRLKTPLPAGIKVISVDLTTEGLNNGTLTLVDTRAAGFYDAGHIPGSVSLALSKLEKRITGLLPENKQTKLVFYDEGQGGDSAGKAAEISVKAGYRDVAIYQEGLAGWTESGRQLASSTSFIRKKQPVVIDIRSKDQATLGHIEKSVNYPFSALKDYVRYLPINKLTPIVIYGASDIDAAEAAAAIRSRGYRRVTIYPGGASSWEKSAEVLESGPAGTEITSKAANHGGELDTKDFAMALASPVMIEIIDVRHDAEHKKGGFPNSRQIPLRDLAKRAGDLNRDKIQVIFAADPIQAEMAYDYLKSKGFKLNYLNGSVEFEKNGTYSVK